MSAYKEIIYTVGIVFLFSLVGVLFAHLLLELTDFVSGVFIV